jgi:RNA polymerase sigma factor (sigma-70 family)
MSLVAEKWIPTRYSLLSRLQNWTDQESWRQFFDTYARLIYGVALKSGLSDTEAQDVVQETVICVAKDIQKFTRDPKLGSFKGWLRNIARWRIADQLRKRQKARVPVVTDDGTDLLEQLPDPAGGELDRIWEEEWEQNLWSAATDRAKARVKAEHYQIFDLYVLKKWPVTKVARTLGINVAQVYLAKHRVGNVIKEELRQLEKKPM